jgi:hypothetical protein
MVSLLALFLGFTGMLGFWGLAWWLLKQPVLAAIEPSPPQSMWRNEPTGGRGITPVPSSAFEEPDEESAPNIRAHESSSSNTQFFNRADANRRDVADEGTAILQDSLPSAERTEFLTNPFPENPIAPPPPSRPVVVPPLPKPAAVPPPPPRVGSRKTWLLGGSGMPDGQ